MKKRNELLAKTVIKGLESGNMSGYYAQDKEAALKQALKKSLWCGARRDGWSRPLPLGAPRPMIFK